MSNNKWDARAESERDGESDAYIRGHYDGRDLGRDESAAALQAALNARAGGDGDLVARFKLACRTLTRDRVVFGEDVETLHEVLRIIEADYAPLAGTYEWFDSVEEVWRPIDRLPYKWERELGIPWRDAALASQAVGVK